MYQRYIKRFMDFTLALIALIVLSPVMLTVALLVRVKLGSPVLFKQLRPGKNEQIFAIYKFRTMADERDKTGALVPDDIRLTRFGRALRSTSLDELPELYNIIKGDMSLVGPRPQLVRDMVFMTPEQRRRHDIRPGLSGWAQINGRNAIEWEDKLNYDLEYLDKLSFWVDAKIVLITIKKVFKTESISYEGMATAEDFGDYLLRTGKTSQEQYDEGREEAKELLKL